MTDSTHANPDPWLEAFARQEGVERAVVLDAFGMLLFAQREYLDPDLFPPSSLEDLATLADRIAALTGETPERSFALALVEQQKLDANAEREGSRPSLSSAAYAEARRRARPLLRAQ